MELAFAHQDLQFAAMVISGLCLTFCVIGILSLGQAR